MCCLNLNYKLGWNLIEVYWPKAGFSWAGIVMVSWEGTEMISHHLHQTGLRCPCDWTYLWLGLKQHCHILHYRPTRDFSVWLWIPTRDCPSIPKRSLTCTRARGEMRCHPTSSPSLITLTMTCCKVSIALLHQRRSGGLVGFASDTDSGVI